MTPRTRVGIIIAAFVAITALAVAGWVRKPVSAQAFTTSVPAAMAPAVGTLPPEPCAQPVAPAPGTPTYAHRSGVRVVRQQAPPVQQQAAVRHGRSTGKSAAIVAGSAGLGAAIGALAGGGKGAAIGALAGGGGGFAYDRLTHNR